MGGLGCEVTLSTYQLEWTQFQNQVTKNLVLAGIKELRMVDAKKVSEEDSTSQFLAPRDEVLKRTLFRGLFAWIKVGKNRAEASLARVQQLNPMVEVTADSASSEEKEADFFKKFDVVIATTCSQAELVRINSICRAANILFYAGDVFGFFGFSFMDLVSHNFVEEVTTQVFFDPIQGWATERHFLTRWSLKGPIWSWWWRACCKEAEDNRERDKVGQERNGFCQPGWDLEGEILC